jgi:hypothetical protein
VKPPGGREDPTRQKPAPTARAETAHSGEAVIVIAVDLKSAYRESSLERRFSSDRRLKWFTPDVATHIQEKLDHLA